MQRGESDKTAKYLYDNIPLREAIVHGKRCNYFRGKKLIELMLEDSKKPEYVPKCKNEADAMDLGYKLIRQGYIHASRVKNKERRELELIKASKFDKDGYYIWQWEPSSRTRNFMLAIFIIAFLGFTMYPIWPRSAKVGIWYISLTLLIFLVGFTMLRLIVYILFWLIGYEFWIFPNLFDDDLGVIDSFKPFISFEKSEDFKEMLIYRIAVVGAIGAFAYWVYIQPTEFDEFMVIQRKFVEDLYAGNLLSDESHKTQEELDKIIPNLEELKKKLEEEEKEMEENMEKMMEEDEIGSEDQKGKE